MEFWYKLYRWSQRSEHKNILILGAIAFILGLFVYKYIYQLPWASSFVYTSELFAMDLKTPFELKELLVSLHGNQALCDLEGNLHPQHTPYGNQWWVIYIAAFFATATLIITIALLFFQDKISLWYRRKLIANGEHTIVIGLGRNSRFFIDSLLLKAPHRIIVFEKYPDHPYLAKYQAKKIAVVTESIENIIPKLNLQKSQYLFISTGDDEQNIYLALQFLEQLKGSKTFKQLLVHIEDRTLRNFYSDGGALNAEGINIKVFSYHKESARMLFQTHPLKGCAGDFYINIIGDNDLSISLMIEAYKLAHFPNGNHLRINLISKNIQSLKKNIEYAFPEIDLIPNIHLHYCPLDDQSASFYRADAPIWNCQNLQHVFYCHDNVTRNISIATKVADLTFLRRAKEAKKIKFHIATMNHLKIAREIERFSAENLFVFASADKVCSYDNLLKSDIDRIAQYIHYDYYHSQQQPRASPEELWRSTSIYHKKSSIAQAIHLRTKLAYLNLDIERYHSPKNEKLLIQYNKKLLHQALEIQNINELESNPTLDKLAIAEHSRWVALLRTMDYQYRDIKQKDDLQKLHPLLKPLCDFTPEELEKHRLFDINAILRIAIYEAKVGNILKRKPNKKEKP